jgi:hypothetical protein
LVWAFEDFEHNRGSAQVATVGEPHPAIVTSYHSLSDGMESLAVFTICYNQWLSKFESDI